MCLNLFNTVLLITIQLQVLITFRDYEVKHGSMYEPCKN